jgi:hypothetical protein
VHVGDVEAADAPALGEHEGGWAAGVVGGRFGAAARAYAAAGRLARLAWNTHAKLPCTHSPGIDAIYLVLRPAATRSPICMERHSKGLGVRWGTEGRMTGGDLKRAARHGIQAGHGCHPAGRHAELSWGALETPPMTVW